MASIFRERFRNIPNLYWQPNQPINAPIRKFRQIKYLPLFNAVPDIDQTLSGAMLDCERELNKQKIEFGGASKVDCSPG